MDTVRLVLAGDVMLGRGVDQVMPDPLPPRLYEPWVHDAREYVRLAERAHGPIPAPVDLGYPWGEALRVMDRMAPELRIVNLETALTANGTPWPGKGIHYRMNPLHAGSLCAARIDACSLANNHVLDWGVEGLSSTLAALRREGIATAGAGADERRARSPTPLALRHPGRRVLLSAWATPDSGVMAGWAATRETPGIAVLHELDAAAARRVLSGVQAQRRQGDLVIVSLHWGGNWVDEVPAAHRVFARRLIDIGAADLVHGHSSHHPLPMEVHAGKLILYGCGDLINDYEGIDSPGPLRSDVGCLYAATLSAVNGSLLALEIVPLQLRRFRLEPPDPLVRQELHRMLDAGCRRFGTRLETDPGGSWQLAWS
ncbi:CapA family protein [Azohydromonas caseinilytica]|uniref:CapA family protein n=1 Tax=Azohydromonas caseinilytica TaxID=2728836 RepID=A0A848FFK9_9BURK|nr:CapA family protein [Azohydromonas caseinilytica]NML18218.1 CapA family protein [Azohydromonas caseinilytica]